MAIACPSCGTRHTLNSHYCSKCGEFMGFGERPKVIGHACPKCGTAVRADGCFCTACGTKLSQGATPDQDGPEETEPANSKE